MIRDTPQKVCGLAAALKLRCFYFGCMDKVGHGVWDRDHWGQYPKEIVLIYDTEFCQSIDGKLPPQLDRRTPGAARFNCHHGGWVSVAFWDDSVDKRPGSNSAFFINSAMFEADDVLIVSRLLWPEVFKRLDFEILFIDGG